jgi:hypothetical protein
MPYDNGEGDPYHQYNQDDQEEDDQEENDQEESDQEENYSKKNWAKLIKEAQIQ